MILEIIKLFINEPSKTENILINLLKGSIILITVSFPILSYFNLSANILKLELNQLVLGFSILVFTFLICWLFVWDIAQALSVGIIYLVFYSVKFLINLFWYIKGTIFYLIRYPIKSIKNKKLLFFLTGFI